MKIPRASIRGHFFRDGLIQMAGTNPHQAQADRLSLERQDPKHRMNHDCIETYCKLCAEGCLAIDCRNLCQGQFDIISKLLEDCVPMLRVHAMCVCLSCLPKIEHVWIRTWSASVLLQTRSASHLACMYKLQPSCNYLLLSCYDA